MLLHRRCLLAPEWPAREGPEWPDSPAPQELGRPFRPLVHFGWTPLSNQCTRCNQRIDMSIA